MICDFLSYTTLGNVRISRNITKVKMDTALDEILFHRNQVRRDLLSSYEHPQPQITTRDNAFTITSLNPCGQVLLPTLCQNPSTQSPLPQINLNHHHITGYIQKTFPLPYKFAAKHDSSQHLLRTGQSIDYRGEHLLPNQTADHQTGKYTNLIEQTLDYFPPDDFEQTELTISTDVDRNHKLRIRQPGSVRVISRRRD